MLQNFASVTYIFCVSKCGFSSSHFKHTHCFYHLKKLRKITEFVSELLKQIRNQRVQFHILKEQFLWFTFLFLCIDIRCHPYINENCIMEKQLNVTNIVLKYREVRSAKFHKSVVTPGSRIASGTVPRTKILLI